MLYTDPKKESNTKPALDSASSWNKPRQLHDALREKDIAEKRERLEKLNQDLDQLSEEFYDITEVIEKNNTLPANERNNDENLDPYKEEYPDLFEDDDAQHGLGLVSKELKNLGREKLEEKEALKKELPSSTGSPVKADDDLLDMPSYLDEMD